MKRHRPSAVARCLARLTRPPLDTDIDTAIAIDTDTDIDIDTDADADTGNAETDPPG